MRTSLPLGAVALGISLLIAGCNLQVKGVIGVSASPDVVATAGGTTTLRWQGNSVTDYKLSVSPNTGVKVNGTAYAGPVDMGTSTTATVTLPANSTNHNVSYTFTVSATGSSGASLASQTATATVAMSAQGLWIADYGTSTIDFFASGTLGTTSTPAATITKGVDRARVLAFDKNGNLWVANEAAGNNAPLGTGTITEYAAVGLTADPTPVTTIDTGPYVVGLAFDANGNLWTTNYDSNSVSEYSASSLSNNPNAIRTITGLNGPLSLAFDKSGNLWVVNYNSNSVTEYTAASLSTTPAKGATISNGLDKPEGLAFDANGNLWVGNQAGGTVVRYAAANLTSNPSPAAVLSTGASNNSGVTLDASGNLWVTHQGSTIDEYTAASVAATGNVTVTANASITSLSRATMMPAFNPPPANLPLH